jgi:hypothetical protein
MRSTISCARKISGTLFEQMWTSYVIEKYAYLSELRLIELYTSRALL